MNWSRIFSRILEESCREAGETNWTRTGTDLGVFGMTPFVVLRPFALPCFRWAPSILRPWLTPSSLSLGRSPRARCGDFRPASPCSTGCVFWRRLDFAFARTLIARTRPLPTGFGRKSGRLSPLRSGSACWCSCDRAFAPRFFARPNLAVLALRLATVLVSLSDHFVSSDLEPVRNFAVGAKSGVQ